MANKILLLIAFVYSINCKAQDVTTPILSFYITEAYINGYDVSNVYTEKNAFLTFYKVNGDSTLYLANVWPDNQSQSYGVVRAHPLIVNNEPYENKKSLRSYYEWYYKNTYNSDSGTGFVELIQVFENSDVKYIVKIKTEQFDILTYKGKVAMN